MSAQPGSARDYWRLGTRILSVDVAEETPDPTEAVITAEPLAAAGIATWIRCRDARGLLPFSLFLPWALTVTEAGGGTAGLLEVKRTSTLLVCVVLLPTTTIKLAVLPARTVRLAGSNFTEVMPSGATNGAGDGLGAAVTDSVNVAVSVPAVLLAERATLNVPTAVGVPVIAPVLGSTVRPAGRPLALKVSSMAVVVIW